VGVSDRNDIIFGAVGIWANKYDVIWLEYGNHTVPTNTEDFSFS